MKIKKYPVIPDSFFLLIRNPVISMAYWMPEQVRLDGF
jgi:hypothetical protein